MKKFWIRKGLMFVTFFIVAVLVFATIVMTLWNAILPAVLGVKAITFVQALGILVLSKILFGGFGRRGGGMHRERHDQWRNGMKEKFASMTPEEKEKFKAEWKNRCGSRGWRMNRESPSSSAAE